MSVKSAPYYWLECDECGGKSTEGSDTIAWSDIEGATENARDVGWKIMLDGRHYCEEDEHFVCDTCGAFDPTEYPGDRDYVSIRDEWAPRLMHWRPFVITDDGDNGVHWLPSSASRSFAECRVRAYLDGVA